MSPYSIALLILALVFLVAGVSKIRPGLVAVALLCMVAAWMAWLLPASQAVGR